MERRNMGLDSVEIVIGWEEALGVTIADEEAQTIRTPSMATDLLAAKVGATDRKQGACLSLRAFSKIRTGFMAGAGLSRARISPKARIRELLPRNRKPIWRDVHSASGLPALPAVGWGVGILFEPVTVADVIRWVVCHSVKSLKPPDEPWTRSEVRQVVRAVVSEVCGATGFSDDDDFVRDLGID